MKKSRTHLIELEESSKHILIAKGPISKNTVKISATPSNTMTFLVD